MLTFNLYTSYTMKMTYSRFLTSEGSTVERDIGVAREMQITIKYRYQLTHCISIDRGSDNSYNQIYIPRAIVCRLVQSLILQSSKSDYTSLMRPSQM